MTRIKEFIGAKESEPIFLPLTREARVYIVYICLFATITSAQYVVSLPPFANSLALRADCVSMLVDTISYTFNLIAVIVNFSPRRKRNAELIVSGLSLALLLGLTSAFAAEAVDDIEAAQNDEGDGDVGVEFVLAFAILGLVFDGSGIAAFYFCPEDEEDGADKPILMDDGNAIPSTGLASKDALAKSSGEAETAETEQVCGVNINMLSANAHLLSDLLRSSTTLLEGILILSTDINSTLLDGISALIICCLIIIGGVGSSYFWVQEVRQELARRKEEEQNMVLEYEGAENSNGSY